jgi:HlyD family secretion protein
MTQIVPQPSRELSESESVEHPKKPHPRLLIVLVGVAIAAVAVGIWYWRSQQTSTGLIQLSGRIEGYDTDIGAKIAGRINAVAVREGDQVTKGQVIVRLDDDEIQAQLRSATAQVASAKQQVEQARWQLSVIASQIEEARLNIEQSKGDTQGRITQAQSNVATAAAQLAEAQAQLAQAGSQLKLAQINRDRYARLRKDGAVSQDRLDQAQTDLESAQATVKARQAEVNAVRKQGNAAEGALVQAQTTQFNPNIQLARQRALQRQLDSAQAQLQAAASELAAAQANRQQIQAQIAYLNVVSPINGVVTARSVEPGAVVTSGKTLLTVINPDTVYLRGFIPEGEIGKVRVKQPARVFLDSAPSQPLRARVIAIDTEASFTPENIYFQQDRVKQVFGVKIGIDQPAGLAKPGMPADAEIEIGQTAKN